MGACASDAGARRCACRVGEGDAEAPLARKLGGSGADGLEECAVQVTSNDERPHKVPSPGAETGPAHSGFSVTQGTTPGTKDASVAPGQGYESQSCCSSVSGTQSSGEELIDSDKSPTRSDCSPDSSCGVSPRFRQSVRIRRTTMTEVLAVVTRNPRRRRQRRLKIIDTMGVIPSAALQLVISNPGNLSEFYDLNTTATLGEGSFGVVRRATVRATGAVRAVKSIAKKRMVGKIGALKQEVEIMMMIDHPHVIMLYEIFEDDQNLFLVMELCDGGHLQEYVKRMGYLNQRVAAGVMRQLLRGVAYLHKCHICHRDLKSENCLLQADFSLERNSLKVADFGLSCTFKPRQVLTSTVGTLTHMAPEVLAKKYNQACDVWSCGVIMYYVLCGYLPFDSKEECVRRGKFTFASNVWCDVEEDAVSLIYQMLSKNQKARCTAEQALRHRYIQKKAPRPEDVPLKLSVLQNLRAYRSFNKFKRATLSVVASLLSEDETRESREIFNSLDENGDGVLTMHEMAARLARDTGQDMADLPDIFKGEDDNVKGFTYNEFLAAMFDRQTCGEDVLRAAFATFDKNGDGGISMCELAGGRLVGNFSEAELQRTLSELDKNGDGHIDFEEFMAMMKSW